MLDNSNKDNDSNELKDGKAPRDGNPLVPLRSTPAFIQAVIDESTSASAKPDLPKQQRDLRSQQRDADAQAVVDRAAKRLQKKLEAEQREKKKAEKVIKDNEKKEKVKDNEKKDNEKVKDNEKKDNEKVKDNEENENNEKKVKDNEVMKDNEKNENSKEEIEFDDAAEPDEPHVWLERLRDMNLRGMLVPLAATFEAKSRQSSRTTERSAASPCRST